MTKAKILLQSISDVKEFVSAVSMCDFDLIAYTDDSQALFSHISKFVVK